MKYCQTRKCMGWRCQYTGKESLKYVQMISLLYFPWCKLKEQIKCKGKCLYPLVCGLYLDIHNQGTSSLGGVIYVSWGMRASPCASTACVAVIEARPSVPWTTYILVGEVLRMKCTSKSRKYIKSQWTARTLIRRRKWSRGLEKTLRRMLHLKNGSDSKMKGRGGLSGWEGWYGPRQRKECERTIQRQHTHTCMVLGWHTAWVHIYLFYIHNMYLYYISYIAYVNNIYNVYSYYIHNAHLYFFSWFSLPCELAGKLFLCKVEEAKAHKVKWQLWRQKLAKGWTRAKMRVL